MPERRELTTLRRGIELLIGLGCEEAVQAGGLGVTRLAERSGEEKSQVSRTLKTLAATGAVDRDPKTGTYRLGWQLYALAARSGDQRLREAAPPLLRRLAEEFGERAHLSVLQGRDVLTIWTQCPPNVVVLTAGWVGRTVPAWCTSSGRALLFDYDRRGLGALFAGVDFRGRGPHAPDDVDDLYRRVAAAAQQGSAVVEDEYEPGLVAVAAPVRDPDGRIVAAINVSAPSFRFRERLNDAATRTKTIADELSWLLGGNTDWASQRRAGSDSEVIARER
ncbi:MAG: IclR family transcriptional regulator [Candidatus Dormibacteraeota bacterium]|uniref:IclR family transcriptional regulator n=1 Tax=Candidatus Dormiibacter inghamiae TaxID=3127013 RepID=A0A934K6W2_9BACT|nr:IclR family transcriptional regulator [Candidatus Dormibacteraeota bacterium]MBJ7605243.1 IclR family transcriptional regulator [Candidatus Dormibacteraeota bacterium]